MALERRARLVTLALVLLAVPGAGARGPGRGRRCPGDPAVRAGGAVLRRGAP